MDEWELPVDQDRPEPQRNLRLIAVTALVLVGIAGGVFWRLRAERGAGLTAAAPDTGAGGPVALDAAAPPPKSLAEGDALLRKLAAEGSKAPPLAEWLAAPEITQRLAAAVRLIATGASPKTVLSFIGIEGEFAVVEHVTPGSRKRASPGYFERVFIAPKSYARYDGLTKTVTSIDPAYAGRAYAQLRPYFDAAFAEVAGTGERFDDVFKAALDRLISVKVPEGPVELVPKGAIYLFKDPSLESLQPAEKHLIRMGPKNAKAVQDLLRSFRESAGFERRAG